MFARYFIKIGSAIIAGMLILTGIICYNDSINPMELIFPGKPSTESFHIIPETINKSQGLESFDRIVVDGDSEAVRVLYERVAKEAQKLPDVFINIFNETGFKIVVTDNVYKYTKQYIPQGFYLGGVTQIHGSDRRVVLFPVKGDRTSLYHELGHVIIFTYNMEEDSLSGIWKYDLEGAVALTGEYAGTNANECWAEAFRFILQNMEDPEKMAEAARLMPVSYSIFQSLLEYGKEAA